MGIGKIISPMVPGASKPLILSKLDPGQKLLLYGDDKAGNDSDRWKPLWESEPENPAYLAEYAGAYFRVHKNLSPEILAAAEKIDPDNGWFLAFAAATSAESAVKREKRSEKDTKDGKAAVITILDENRLNEALATLHQIAAKPRFASYQTDLFRQRIPLFPPRRDFVSQIPLMVYATSMYSPGISFRKFSDVLAAGAQQCAAKRDVEGFHRIINDWRAVATGSVKGGDTLIDLLVAKVIFTGPAANFRDSARSLGLEEEARYFGNIDERSRMEKDARDQRRRTESAEEELFRKKSSILGGLSGALSGRQVQSPPALTDEDVRPARYTDHALVGRVFSGFGWALLGVGVVTAASARYRKSPLAGGLSGRMTDLLHPWDWVWLFLGGVVFPVLWYLLITRLTPLTAREWSVTFLTFIPVGGQFGSFLLSLFILPTVIASGLLAKRGAVFGFALRFPWLGWLAVVAALAGVPAFGATPFFADAGNLVFVSAIFPVCSVVAWILSGLGFNAIGRESRELRRATLWRIVLPVWVFGMLALALLIQFHYAEEQRWIQRDRLGEISPDAPAMGRYEYDVTQVLRSELLERIGQAGEIR